MHGVRVRMKKSRERRTLGAKKGKIIKNKRSTVTKRKDASNGEGKA
jgi:hypothetical protein